MLEFTKPVWNNIHCIIPIKFRQNLFKKVIKHNGVDLYLKSEFHITFIGNRIAKEIDRSCSIQQKEELKEFVNNIKINASITEEIFFLRKRYTDHERYSRIILIELKDLDKINSNISDIIGFEYKLFPHITTHTNATEDFYKDIGIGVLSFGDLKKHVF